MEQDRQVKVRELEEAVEWDGVRGEGVWEVIVPEQEWVAVVYALPAEPKSLIKEESPVTR
jgi:hypothetical protein